MRIQNGNFATVINMLNIYEYRKRERWECENKNREVRRLRVIFFLKS